MSFHSERFVHIPSKILNILNSEYDTLVITEIFPKLDFLDCSHLPEHLQLVAVPIYKIGKDLAVNWLTSYAEGLVSHSGLCYLETCKAIEKLIEAKDCAVRARLKHGH